MTRISTRGLAVAFSASALLTLLGLTGWIETPWLYWIFKPLTLAILLAAVLGHAVGGRGRYAWAVAAGLALSLAGDVFLMLPRDFFLHGLVCFLFAHLAYLVAFTDGCRFLPRPLPVVALVVVAGAVMAFLWPGLGAGLRVPVVVYVAALSAMAAQAMGRAGVLSTQAARVAAWGAGLFVLSDALLAINRFRAPFAGAHVAVMVTYFAAQWLIARSALGVESNG